MEEFLPKVSNDENDNLEKDEIPPDSDLKNEYQENSEKEEQENNEINEIDNKNKISKIIQEKNKEKEINEENQDNKNNEKIEEDDNQEEQKKEINDIKKINEEKFVNKADVKKNEKDNNIIIKEGKYIVTETGEVYELIHSKDGNQVYKQLPPQQPYQMNQNYQQYEIANQIQEYPIIQQNQIYGSAQLEQVNNLYQLSQTGQEYQIFQTPIQYQTVQQNHGYHYNLPNQTYQYMQQTQTNPIFQPNQNYQYLNTGNQGYQYSQVGLPYEIFQQILQNLNSQQFISNQNIQNPQQNQLYQVLGQPFEYKEEQNTYIPVYFEGNEYKKMTNNDEPKIYQQDKRYKKNVIKVKKSQNNNNNNYKEFENNNRNQMSQFRKGIHQVNLNKKMKEKKIKRKSSNPKDSTPKKYKKSKAHKNLSFSRNSKGCFFYPSLPRLISFNDMSTKKISIDSSMNLEKENLSEFIEIPRKKYEEHANIETLYIDSGIDKGKYLFMGSEEKINVTSQTPSRVHFSQEDVMNEIAKRSNSKKASNLKYIMIDKYYTITDFERTEMKEEQLKKFKKEKERIYGLNELNKEYNIRHFKSQSMFQPRLKMKLKAKTDIDEGISVNPRSSCIEIENNKNSIKFDVGLSLTPVDNYSRYLLEQINKIRNDPQSFIGVIEDAKANIIRRKYGGIIYKSKMKIALYAGEPTFDEAIHYLEKMDSMKKLQFCPQLTAKLPQNESEIMDKDDLRRKVEDMIDNGINVRTYWRDVIRDPEISFLLMIVDDNGIRKGMRRRDLLNPYMKYIGISSVEINNKFVCYITLSSKLEK